MVVNSEELGQLFTRLGISDNEGKVYAALLAANPATAYEAAKEAGVPTSKVYEVLERLASRGMVRELDEAGRKRYVPQPPEDFVEATRLRLGGTLDALKDGLLRVAAPTDEAHVWPLTDEAAVLDKACRLVAGAAEAVLVSAWTTEARVMAPFLQAARARGVKTALVHFGPGELGMVDEPGPANTFRHPIEDTLYAEKGGRGLTVVADGREALMALLEDYIKHDIYVMKIVARFDTDLQRRFGPHYEKLRDVWSDEENPL